jgi:hypothetical protein
MSEQSRSDSSAVEADINDLVGKLAARAGGETPILLLRLEVEFLTVTLQGLLGGIAPFADARLTFLRERLGQLVDERSKPRLHIAGQEG